MNSKIQIATFTILMFLASIALAQQNILVQTTTQPLQNQQNQQVQTNVQYPFPVNGIANSGNITGNNNSGYFVQTSQTTSQLQNNQLATQGIATQSIAPVPTITPTVRIYLDKPVLTGNMAIYQPGERILVTAQLSSPGYLYLFNINSVGQTVQLFPNEFDRDNLISNTQAITIPRNSQYAFNIEGPNGVDSIVAIASQRSLQGNQITFGDIRNLSSAMQSTRPASYWSSDLAQIQVGLDSFAAVQSPIISTQTVPNQSDMTQGTIYMTPLGSTGNTSNATVDLYSNSTANNTTSNTGTSNTGTSTAGTSTSTVPAYCSTAANQSRPECGGSSNSVTSTANSNANATGSYPAYCSYAQYNSRSECAGAAITNSSGTSTATSSASTSSASTSTSSSRPAYCSTPANQSRPECGGASTSSSSMTSTTTPATATSYPQYCSYAQYNSRTECAGATVTDSSTASTSTSSSTATSYPAYCSTPANQYRTECGGSGQSSQAQTTTTTAPATTSYPQYCSYAQYNSRAECVGATITSGQSQTTPSQMATTQTASMPQYCSYAQYQTRPECAGSSSSNMSTSTNTSTSYPAYCSTPANQYRTECGGTGQQSTSSTPSSSSSTSYPQYCSSSQYQNRSECAGYSAAYGTSTNTATTNTNTMPAYCSSQANYSRPECVGAGASSNTFTTSNAATSTNTTSNSQAATGYNSVAGSSIYPANTPIGVWQRLGAQNYSYLITRNCRCPDIYRQPLYVTVQNGRITNAIFTQNQSNASQEIIQSVPTLDELMQFALQFSQSNVAAVQAEYDVNYGFPTSIFLDSNVNATDDEVAYTVSGFQLN